MMEVPLRYIVKKNLDKIKLEIDLLRDSLRNIFVVMFGIISSVSGLIYKILLEFSYIDLFFIITGLIVFIIIGNFRIKKMRELNEKLKELG